MKFIRLTQVMEMTGLARSTIYKLIAAEQFPASVALGGKSVAWVLTEVEDWMLAKIAERDQQSQNIG